MSTPMTLPSGPTSRAARKASTPAPDPRSRTVSPRLGSASPIGFPHPRPRLAPSGIAAFSSALYPRFAVPQAASAPAPAACASPQQLAAAPDAPDPQQPPL